MKVTEILNEMAPETIFNNMIDDLSVQALVADITVAREKGVSWEELEKNVEKYEDNANTKLSSDERDAMFEILKGQMK